MTKSEFKNVREVHLRLTQQELALQLGLVRISVLRYENGQRRLPGSIVLALQQLLNKPPRLLLLGLVAAGTPI